MERAWERSSTLGSPALEPIERAALAGATVAPVAAAPAGLLYLVRFYGIEDLPWAALAPQLASFVAVTGALYAAGVACGVVLASRVHPITAPALAAAGGAVFGLAPGAFAAWHFGSMDAPWFGGHGIALAAALGAIAMGTAIVRSTHPALSWSRAVLLALAPLPLFGPLALAAIALGAQQVDWQAISPLVARIGAIPVGMLIGALVGMALGAWIGSSGALALVDEGRRGRGRCPAATAKVAEMARRPHLDR